MTEPRKDLGENDVEFMDTAKNVAEKVSADISHLLHPLTEQYAKLFKTGVRTPVIRSIVIRSSCGLGLQQ